MKKILFLLSMLPMMCFAQEHIDFKGIPLEGDLDSYVSKMKEAGYNFIKIVDGDIALMEGKFTGKDAQIYISATPKTKTVCRVFVFLEKHTSWTSLKNEYFKYKDLYKQKYGEDSESFEFFKDPYYEGDGYELQAVGLDKCNYATFYNTDKGTIAIEIASTKAILIGYEDKININLFKEEKTSEALNDI